MKSIKIINHTGLANDTGVFNSDGQRIGGVTKVEIQPITPDGMVNAILKFESVELDITTHDDNGVDNES